ncbi:peptidoglycan-binding domain-containing protein [Nonomuraea sp. NPDC046570]|uniref:peptidoglycan-binding domain-containing protein n=1 Tax=Nonomuraea sp. NPDC046570 TaxID=3155255 RepID=UPI0033E40C48
MTRTETEISAPPDAPPPRRRRGPVRAIALTGGVGLLAAAVVTAALGFGGQDAGTPAATRTPPAIAKVTRTTLTETKTVDGTLGYGATTTVSATAQGTITWLPTEGATITRGRAVYSVDADRIPLLYGTTPLYRTLQNGVEGADAALLERNLAKLGYDGFTVDDEYTWSTAQAVEEWQKDLGLPITGRIEPAAVVVSDGPLRVTELKATLGAPASGPVLTYSGTTREVLVNLDAADRHLVKKGMKATVELPDGSTTPGKIASIGKVATTTGTGDETSTTVELRVSVKVKSFDTAPVEVTIVSAERENVLAVPVGALVALAEGGYGVQIADGPATGYAAVETSMFADGQVEVTGVEEGVTVVVPK